MAVSISVANMHFIVMILFLLCYNVSLSFACDSVFDVNVVTYVQYKTQKERTFELKETGNFY